MIQTIILRRDKPADREKAARFLAKLPPDKPWRIEVGEYKPRRSEQQNRYVWGVCYATICKHFEGWRSEDVHEYMLGRHFGFMEIGTMDGARKVPIRRSSRLNKQEFTDFVATIHQIAGEHGIFIPDPEYGDT